VNFKLPNLATKLVRHRTSLFNKIGKEFVVMNFRIFPEHKSTLQGQWSRRCVDSGFT